MIPENIIKMLSSKNREDRILAAEILRSKGVSIEDFCELDNLWFKSKMSDFWYIPDFYKFVEKSKEFSIIILDITVIYPDVNYSIKINQNHV